MAYTPINWQTGDTITAEKMNKMDNGWSIENTQLFSETVTTELDDYGEYSATLVYSGSLNSDTLIVTFNGTDYTCVRNVTAAGYSIYGGFSQAPDYSEYPFYIMSTPTFNFIATENAGTYTVAIATMSTVVSSDFEKAVAVAEPSRDFEIIPGTTTWAEAYAALRQSKNVYYFLTTESKVLVLTVVVTDLYRVYGVTVGTSGTINITALSASSEDGVLS